MRPEVILLNVSRVYSTALRDAANEFTSTKSGKYSTNDTPIIFPYVQNLCHPNPEFGYFI